MTPRFRRTRMFLSFPRLVPHILMMICIDKKAIIRADLIRWAEILGLETPKTSFDLILDLIEFMTLYKEFRNVFYLRCGIKSVFISWMCPPLSSLQIVPSDIGPGLFIQHGLATVVSAQKIGMNCWINQQVTIGFSNRFDRPTIGDNVTILAGAKILGNVTVGDNATVGANTVVITDVPPNATVFGVPGKILYRTKPVPVPRIVPSARIAE